MDDSQSVGFQLPKPVFPHPEQLPRGISLTKKKFDRACAVSTPYSSFESSAFLTPPYYCLVRPGQNKSMCHP